MFCSVLIQHSWFSGHTNDVLAKYQLCTVVNASHESSMIYISSVGSTDPWLASQRSAVNWRLSWCLRSDDDPWICRHWLRFIAKSQARKRPRSFECIFNSKNFRIIHVGAAGLDIIVELKTGKSLCLLERILLDLYVWFYGVVVFVYVYMLNLPGVSYIPIFLYCNDDWSTCRILSWSLQHNVPHSLAM